METGFARREVVAPPTTTCQYQRRGAAGGDEPSRRHRMQAQRNAAGRVLEVGASDLAAVCGYERVCFLALVCPSDEVRAARNALPVASVQISDSRLERLPFPTAAFDIVVCTFSLCTANRPDGALGEIRRVLRSSGSMMFLEHTRGRGVVGRTQDRIEAMLRGSGWCRPNLDVLEAVREAGFVLRDVTLSWPRTRALHAPLVQGVAAHPDSRSERAFRWLHGEGR